MKLYLLSDLHIEFEDFEPLQTGYDIAILAGDIHVGTRGIEWIKKKFANKTVIYVLGNHEFYRSTYPLFIEKVDSSAKGTSIHVLENQSVEINDTVFIGCTFWTDFDLFGKRELSGFEAEQGMNDFHLIRFYPGYRRFRWTDALSVHQNSKRWLEAQFLKYKNKKKIIVTHHAPAIQSVHEQYKNELLTAAFVSDCNHLVEMSEALFWVHGHTHNCFDYYVGQTRVICNAKGYPGEIKDFNPHLIVDTG